MIHMRAFMSPTAMQQVQNLLYWGKLKQDQLRQAILITKDSVAGFLKRQIEKGNWEAVQEILKGKPMTKAGKFLYQQPRDHVVTNLIMRLGLRKVIAVCIALVLLPLILAKVGEEVVGKIKNR